MDCPSLLFHVFVSSFSDPCFSLSFFLFSHTSPYNLSAWSHSLCFVFSMLQSYRRVDILKIMRREASTFLSAVITDVIEQVGLTIGGFRVWFSVRAHATNRWYPRLTVIADPAPIVYLLRDDPGIPGTLSGAFPGEQSQYTGLAIVLTASRLLVMRALHLRA